MEGLLVLRKSARINDPATKGWMILNGVPVQQIELQPAD